MYFNLEIFDSKKEANHLANWYFVKWLKILGINQVDKAWIIAKQSALEQVNFTVDILKKLNSPDTENYKLILQELKILNYESSKIPTGS